MSTFLKHAVQCALWLLLVVSMRTSAQPLPSLAPMLESVTPAVVNISTVTRVRANNPYMNDPFFRRFFENERRGSGDSLTVVSLTLACWALILILMSPCLRLRRAVYRRWSGRILMRCAWVTTAWPLAIPSGLDRR